MTKNYKNLTKLICAGSFVVLGFNSMATTIYDTYGNLNGSLFSLNNGQQVGNEISIPGNSFHLTNFSVAYYAPNALDSTIGLDVRFYSNNGPLTNGYASPGTLLFDSGLFSGLPQGTNSISYTSSDFYGGSTVNLPANFLLPSDFTFTITFTNTAGSGATLDGLEAPLAGFSDAGPGASRGDYWLNNNGAWELLTNSIPANLVVNFSGVPEPSVVYLGAIGGVLLLGINRLKRKY